MFGLREKSHISDNKNSCILRIVLMQKRANPLKKIDLDFCINLTNRLHKYIALSSTISKPVVTRVIRDLEKK